MNVFVLLNTKEDILKNVGNRAVLGTIDFHSIFFFPTMEVNGAPKQPGYKLSSKYLPLCSAEQRHSYRFGTTWGWVNDDIIFIFGWTIPLITHHFILILTKAVSQYQVCKVRTCVLGSSDFPSSTRECELPRTGELKSGNSANGTAVYLITSVSSPKLSTLYYNMTNYDIKHHCLYLFSCKH